MTAKISIAERERALARPRRMAVPIEFMMIATFLGDAAAIAAGWQATTMFGSWDRITSALPVIIVCFAGVAQVSGAYDADSLIQLKRAWPRLANSWLGTIVGIAALIEALDVAWVVPLKAMALWFVCGLLAMAGIRALLADIARRLKRGGTFDGRVAIVGTGAQGREFADHVLRSDDLAIALVGFFSDRAPPAGEVEALTLPYLGDMPDLVDAVRAGAIDKVFVALPWSDDVRLQRVVDLLASTPVEIGLAPDRAGFAYARRRLTSLDGLSVITLLETPLSSVQRAMKAAEDRIIAAAALALLSPVMAAAALAIRLTSPGPVLFRQSREGFNCRPFDILKFRTMHAVPAAAGEPVVQARRADPRITRVGALLRRTSIDELPQLFNVLLGQMSLVGPRPHAPSTRAGGKLFGDVAASYAARHNVKPGITGWAQVRGWRGETTTEDKLIGRLEHDLYYIEHWSIWFDLYIIARTAITVLTQREAY